MPLHFIKHITLAQLFRSLQLRNSIEPSNLFSCNSTMITDKKAANAMGGNTARACDSCMVKRARWFCGADDAFLCQRCDASVHSANLLASRHERVRLKSSSHKLGDNLAIEPPVPAWQQGVTRKARTPRGHGNHKSGKDEAGKVLQQSVPFVPEIGSEEVDYCCLEDDHETEDLEQLLYRVPIFDPFEPELCNNVTNIDHHEVKMGNGHQDFGDRSSSPSNELDNLQGLILPSEMELAEFAADVENMLGKGFDEDCNDIKGLGLMDGTKEEEDYSMDVCIGIEERKLVKIEEEDQGVECEFNPSMMDWSLDYDDESAAVLLGGSTTSTDQEEVEEKVAVLMEAEKKRKKICLMLNYEAVISAWASQGSPWTTGVKPELNPDDGWPDCMGIWGANQIMNLQEHGNSSAAAYRMGMRSDTEQRPGREARVSRYREKRRTRLFSKKIRYEVRKLNAEKRPRMKGRFVKRTAFQMGMGSNTTTTTTSNAPPYQQHQHLKR